MAKGGSVFAALKLEGQEVGGEHRRSDTRGCRSGAVPDADTARWRVLKIQIKLHQWASEDPSRRFDDLFNLVCEPPIAVLLNVGDRGRTGRTSRSAGSGPRFWIPR
jgi:hypothetical protein